MPQLTPLQKEYQAKLLDQRWKIKRLEILERDNYRCRSCGDKDNRFHVHHKYYLSSLDPWEYDNSALMTLCEACHELHHLLDKLNSKDFPPLFMKPFKEEPSVAYASNIITEDYYMGKQTGRRVTFAVRRQYLFLLNIVELAKQTHTVSFETVTRIAGEKLHDMCIRTNFIIHTPHGTFGQGDITDLKPEQYF